MMEVTRSYSEILVDPDPVKLPLVGTVMGAALVCVPLIVSRVEVHGVFEQTDAWVQSALDSQCPVELLSRSRLFDRYSAELSARTGDESARALQVSFGEFLAGGVFASSELFELRGAVRDAER